MQIQVRSKFPPGFLLLVIDHTDPQGNVTILMILGTSESAITIMAVSIPVLRTLFMDDSRRLLASGLFKDASATSSKSQDELKGYTPSERST